MKKFFKTTSGFALVFVILCTCADPGDEPPPEERIPEGFVRIPAGTFMMGQPDIPGATPEHSVTLTKSFYMGKYQVTQAQYQAVMGSNPSNFSSDPANGEIQANRPAEMINWYDALVFCNKLSIKERLSPVYSIDGKTDPADWIKNSSGNIPTSKNPIWDAAVMDMNKNGYRLPTEAEWEYACRAGTTTEYNTGDMISDNTGWYKINSGDKTHEVGFKPANAWGLYDMHGNVNEWCWDWYGNYSSEAQTDPMGASSGAGRVFRGGSWFSPAEDLRSADRTGTDQSIRANTFGFRLVRH